MRLPLSASLLIVLAACTSVPAWQTPEPGAIDSAVAAALPQGTFNVTGEEWARTDGSLRLRSSLAGYVDFGSAPEGADCSAEYILTIDGEKLVVDPERMVATTRTFNSRSVRTAGGPAWIRDESNPTKPGEWRDMADPGAQTGLFMFVPTLIAQGQNAGLTETAGTGHLCSLPTIAHFMTVDGEKLVFDPERVAATARTLTGRWVEKFVDAAGVTGSKRDKTIKELYDAYHAFGLFDSLIKNAGNIAVTTAPDGTVELVQRFENGKVWAKLTFTPTARRQVETVDAETYFERLAAEIENSNKSGWEYFKDQFGL